MIKRVLITGGTGFIGFWVAGWRADMETTVLDHHNYDIIDWDKQDWNYIIHLAPVPIDRVLECAKRCNAAVLFASSGAVYDHNPSDYFKMKLADENKLIYSGVDCKIARIFTTCGAKMKCGTLRHWQLYQAG